ncbi:tRNA nucleotidyltransferase [Caulobacter phage ERS]|uniref:tRNA nucleotidyltransferase n=1 Tax=Caulobacter phage ERS TaxID=3020392 RepID=A0AAE9WXA7_9CAUD|nr:tRNA nucleotidyltransferase [Caulobacter phage ERS]
MRNGPDLWAALLGDIVPVFGGDAVVAGGAIRDFHLGLEPKDIDIWVNCPDPSTFAGRAKLLEQKADTAYNWYLSLTQEAETTYDGTAIGDGMTIYEGNAVIFGDPLYDPEDPFQPKTLADIVVNVIYHPDHQDGIPALVERFDMDICQGWFSGGLLHRTPAMQQALLTKTATALRPSEHARTARRFDRFAARNPGVLTFVNPFQGSLDL